MPFLSINDVPLDVQYDSYEESTREIGETEAAFDGSLRKSRQTVKRDAAFATTPMLSATALAWDSFLRGLGERWSFDSTLYGSKGSAPSASTGASSSATQSKFGGQSLKLVATTGTATFANGGAATPGACYLFWHWNGASWDSWAYNYESGAFQKYKNYVATASTPTGVTVTAALTSIKFDADASDRFIDDLVALPFSVVSTWITTNSLPSTSTAFSNLPELRAAGDCLNEATARTVLCNPTASKFLKVVLAGTFRNNARRLSVEMSEV